MSGNVADVMFFGHNMNRKMQTMVLDMLVGGALCVVFFGVAGIFGLFIAAAIHWGH